MTLLNPDYINLLNTLKERIKQARIKAAVTVNAELLKLYWEIGAIISEQEKIKGWGAKVVVQLSKDLSSEFPDMKGFSQRNLRYMRDFFLAYPELGAPAFLQQAVAKSTTKKKSQILQTTPEKSQNTDNQMIVILPNALLRLKSNWKNR